MNLRIFDSVDDLVHAAARTIRQQIDGGARVIGLSGGSTPKPVYALLGENLPGEAITWVLEDERMVPIDHPESNAGMILATLFAKGIPENHRFIRFSLAPLSGERVPQAGEGLLVDHGQDPSSAFGTFSPRGGEKGEGEGEGELDLAILGVGDDGHTASLFPDTPVLDVNDRVAAMVFVPRLNAWRVTLTLPVLRAAKLRLVLAAGESKRAIVERVRGGEDLPIARVTQGVETWWLIA